MKISIVGAGNVGTTCAEVLVRKEVANEVVLIDVKEGLAEGKALDLSQSAAIEGSDSRIIGSTKDYSHVAGSLVVVITSGLPRKPGMSRDDLIKTNANIMSEVIENVISHAPKAILIVVSNPLDVMTYHAHKQSKLPRKQVIGMAGVLDTARYRSFIAEELHISSKDIQALLLGGHGDTMVPLPRYTTVGGIPVTELLSKEKLSRITERTKVGGGELVKLLGTSAWYAPGQAAAEMVEAIVKDQRRILPACVQLDGEYGIKNCYLGVPIVLGRKGVERIITLSLTDSERALLKQSQAHVSEIMSALDKLKS